MDQRQLENWNFSNAIQSIQPRNWSSNRFALLIRLNLIAFSKWLLTFPIHEILKIFQLFQGLFGNKFNGASVNNKRHAVDLVFELWILYEPRRLWCERCGWIELWIKVHCLIIALLWIANYCLKNWRKRIIDYVNDHSRFRYRTQSKFVCSF